ncbi:MAG: class I SAM-dependent methyltransferase [Oceanospirillales bacterium]|nr:class I SAM-dependent methyltransferase [Oceanospirillales bacterium]
MSENIVNDYGWTSSDAKDSHDYITPEILKTVRLLKSNKILDVGCGNGALCSFLQNEGHQVVGVEYDEQGYQIASNSYKNITFYNYGVQDDPSEIIAKEGLFDVVVSTEVIEHLFSPHYLPQFSSKVLIQNGHLVITTPYHGYLKNLILSILNKWDKHHTSLWHGGHIKFWSKKTITQLLEDNGFKVVGFSGVGRVTYLWKSMVIIAQKI